MLGGQLAALDVAVLGQASIPANVVGLGQVRGGDEGSELVSGVVEDDPVGAVTSPGPKGLLLSCER